MTIQSICVFCGSNWGAIPAYADAARELGRLLAGQRITLVYGGGDVGLMGALADAALEAGGNVIGVIPKFLADKEVAHRRVTQLHIVDSMHERKARMAEISDAFVALPGGYGTLEELCEVVTWCQLQIHDKPCAILNVEGYFDPLIQQFSRGLSEQFIRPKHAHIVQTATSPTELLDRLYAYPPSSKERWTREGEI